MEFEFLARRPLRIYALSGKNIFVARIAFIVLLAARG
jgi:hypothetical protein